MFHKFLKDQSGAVTVDWVVMTAAVVGIGIAAAAVVSDGMDSLSGDVSTQLSGQEISTSFDVASLVTEWSGNMASDYVAYGQSLAPGNNGAVYAHATSMAASEAPSGYNFDNPLYDADSGNVIYTSDDGQNYSIGGVVTPVSSYSGTANYFGA